MRLFAGKHGASKTPTPIRVRISPPNDRTTPIRPVNSDQHATATK
jgi:hypothetical protein